MAAKSLEEVYAGVLSRDWAKLLDAIEAGERRVVCYTTDDRNAKGPAALKTLREHCVVLRGGKFGCEIIYDGTIDTGWIPPGRQSMMEFLEKNGIGFFDPSPKPIPIHVSGVCKSCGDKLEYSEEENEALEKIVNKACMMDLPENPEGDARLKAYQERIAGRARPIKQERSEGGC